MRLYSLGLRELRGGYPLAITDRIRVLFDTALVVVALGLAALVVTRELQNRQAGGLDRPVAHWDSVATGRELGASTGKVVLVEFADYKCTFCRSFRHTLASLRERFGAQLSIRYRHFPLDVPGSTSWSAAIAAECAGGQGAFAEMHEALFAQQESLGVRDWSSYARDARVPDVDAFNRCLTSANPDSVVRRDHRAALELGLLGTPSLLLDGVIVTKATETELTSRIGSLLSREGGQ